MEYNEEEFHEITQCHDWRNYISDELAGMWHTFTNEQRLSIKENAEELASSENWG